MRGPAVDIELTEQQRQVLREQADRPVDVVDPQTRRRYVLLAREEYEQIKPLLDKAEHPTENGVSPGIRASQESYWRDLPRLLKMKSRKGQWVAYNREKRGGFAEDVAELYQKCERKGIPSGEFYVDRVAPRALPPWEVEVL
jgi:hypothetical protein